MLFEKQDYQEKCVQNLALLCENLDFLDPNAKDLAFDALYATQPHLKGELEPSLKIDVLMETGTGKTFTYLKTMYELNAKYAQKHFVLFVPRKAIREGVLANIALSADHFCLEYGKRLQSFCYKGSVSQVQGFLRSNELSLLILTSQAVDKASNLLHKTSESSLDLAGGGEPF